MTLRDELAIAIQAAVGPLVAELGSLCTVYRATQVEADDASTSRTYAADVTWTNVPVVFNPGKGDASSDATQSVAKGFGVRSSAKSTITFIKSATGLPSIAAFDGFKMLDGPYAGYTWLAEADGVADLIGASLTVNVIAAPPGAIT